MCPKETKLKNDFPRPFVDNETWEAARIKIAELGPFYHRIYVQNNYTTELHNHPHDKWQLIVPHLPDSVKDLKCLDVGCNSGFYSLILALNKADVLGIDINQTGLDVVAQATWLESQLKTGAQFQKLDVTKLPKKHYNKYDLVFFTGVYHHLPDTDKALQQINNAMKKNSLMVFGAATNRFGPTKYYAGDSSEFADDSTCFKIATPEDITKDLTDNGFEIITHIHVNSSVFYAVVKKTKTVKVK